MTKIELWQNTLDGHFSEFISGKYSRWEYFEALDDLIIPATIHSKLQRRMDYAPGNQGRSLGAFGLSIYDSTIRERMLVDLWVECLAGRYDNYYLELMDNGLDNSGRIIIDVSSPASDYLLFVDGFGLLPRGEHKLEVKFSPCLWKLTYKIKDLESYVKQNSYVLTILGDSKMIGPNGNPDLPNLTKFDIMGSELKWLLYDAVTLEKLLLLPHLNYREVGGKLAVQINNRDFPSYFKLSSF